MFLHGWYELTENVKQLDAPRPSGRFLVLGFSAYFIETEPPRRIASTAANVAFVTLNECN
jgi:hypothetical protein